MIPIQPTLQSFVTALSNNHDLKITPSSSWRRTNLIEKIIYIIRKIFGTAPDKALELAKGFSEALRNWNINVAKDQIIGISSPSIEEMGLIKSAIQQMKARLLNPQELELKRQIREAKQANNQAALREFRDRMAIVFPLSPKRFAYRELKQHQTRFDLLAKPLSQHALNRNLAVPFQADCNKLRELLTQWQARQYPLVNYLAAEGTKEKIEKTAEFPKYIRMLEKNPNLQDRFFKAVFRNMSSINFDSVPAMILMETTREIFGRTFMDKRMNYYNDQLLQVKCLENSSNPIYTMTLPINGQRVPITNQDHVISISPTTQSSIKDFFSMLGREAHLRVINHEYTERGIEELDLQLTTANLDDPKWWKNLPVVEKLTREQISKKFSIDFSKGHAFFGLCANREDPHHMHVVGTHGYLIAALPLDDGTFNIIYPGCYADLYPVGECATLRHIYNTHRKIWTFIDPSRSLNNREKVQVCTPINQEKFDLYMQLLSEQFKLAREGRLNFQIQADNCSRPLQTITDRIFPELQIPRAFKFKFVNCKARSPLSLLVSARSFCSAGDRGDAQWEKLRKAVSFVFGATKGRTVQTPNGPVTSSIWNDPEWQEGHLHLPSNLFHTADALREVLTKA